MNTTTKGIVAILVLVVVLYGGYRLYHHFTFKTPQAVPVAVAPSSSPVMSPSGAMMSISKMMTTSKGVSYMTNENGMALYTSSKDTAGVSNCSGVCITNWPAYGPKTAPSPAELPTGVTVLTRSDGTLQYVWKGMPLYTYLGDKKAGDVTGVGVGGFSLAK